ncbi:hypothetical protein MKX01_016416 [Papaver californicum]|nr:hypothetical protein MKX01_016416 [Papaver californicum]
MVDGGTKTTSYSDPSELNSSRSRTKGGRGSRGGRRFVSSAVVAFSNPESTSYTTPTTSATASRSSMGGRSGGGGKIGRGARGGRATVRQTLSQTVSVSWFTLNLSQTFEVPKPKKGQSSFSATQ